MLDREMLIDALGRAVSYAVKNRKTENQKTIIAVADMADYLIANDAYSYADHIIIPPLTDKDLQELKDKLAGNGQIMLVPDCEPSVEIVPRWIPVTEGLPQEDEPAGAICEQVQVLLSDGFVTTGWCNRGSKMWFYLPHGETRFIGNDYEKTPVVAWQPLAQPPQEVEE